MKYEEGLMKVGESGFEDLICLLCYQYQINTFLFWGIHFLLFFLKDKK